MKRSAVVIAVALVAAIILLEILRAPSAPDAELKFSRWETNGAATFLLTNRSAHSIRFIAVCSEWKTPPAGYAMQVAPDIRMPLILPAQTQATVALKPPRAETGRAGATYHRSLTLRDRAQLMLYRTHLSTNTVKLGTWIFSEPITTPPPTP